MKSHHEFGLLPGITYLNHGSFGACPVDVSAEANRWRTVMESQPYDFFVNVLPDAVRSAIAPLAEFIGASPGDVVYVDNATAGMNAVCRNFDWQPGDEVVVTEHVYNGVATVLAYLADTRGIKVVSVPVPWPIANSDDFDSAITEAIAAAITERTRLVSIDLIASCSGLIFPVKRIVDAVHERGVKVLVDAAHGPGHLPIDVTMLDADWRDAHGGWKISEHNHEMTTSMAPMLASAWNTYVGAPPEKFGSLATIALPIDAPGTAEEARSVRNHLWHEHQIEVGVMPFADRLWCRISVQLYNTLDDFEYLANAVAQMPGAEV